ncbi:MAG: hypothetical protein DWI29_01535 [Planctomycetota bacterium]|nr:MAG: hypothetical protein DWI29_01535 [Planctomycetota bacterium]
MEHIKFCRVATWFIGLLLLDQRSALAGMPTVSLSDLGRLRLSTISFFLLLVVLSAIGIRFLWNNLRRDFPKLSLLSFRGALTGVLLWGLVFVVVLTMISGARELMTPGAWVKNGLTYQSADQPQQTDSERIAVEVARQLKEQTGRMTQLQLLGTALRKFADQHNGAWPTAEEFRALPLELTTLPGEVPADYLYRPVKIDDVQPAPVRDDVAVVVEPDVFGDGQQFALYRSGLVGPFRRTP